MNTNIDLLKSMLNKKEINYTDNIDELIVTIKKQEIVIKDDTTAYEISTDNYNDVAFDEKEVIAFIEREG
ncbi:hypothetical protein NGB75_11400 [Staphylococcus chromogenes]|uniref:hypothetical protein n=1 Tax=Staphylococcus chromogenes TaxID=46126 RepID=UPI002DB583D3|nr:hypothetical protein [Staphylococcus chromogenes]MEB7433248.1 hypothetical protein [Staphylococcus chromogenes]